MIKIEDEYGTIYELDKDGGYYIPSIDDNGNLKVTPLKELNNFNGEEGTIAIIGPKRMEYERVVNLLNYIKDNIDKNDI